MNIPQESRLLWIDASVPLAVKLWMKKLYQNCLSVEKKHIKKYKNKLKKGCRLSNDQWIQKEESIQALEDIGQWLRYNKSLLLKLFDTQSISDKYTKLCDSSKLFNSYSHRFNMVAIIDATFSKGIIDRGINYLRGVHKYLAL